MCFETRKVRPFKDLKNVQIEFTNNARSMNQLGQFFFHWPLISQNICMELKRSIYQSSSIHKL